jgi:outer membrane protein TolC
MARTRRRIDLTVSLCLGLCACLNLSCRSAAPLASSQLPKETASSATQVASAEPTVSSEKSSSEAGGKANSSRRGVAKQISHAQEPVEPPKQSGDAPLPSPRFPANSQGGQSLPQRSNADKKKDLLRALDPDRGDAPSDALELGEVTLSVVQYFPLIEAARREAMVAEGKQIAAEGAFDLKLQAESMNQPQGFYQNYRQMAKAEQPLWMGGALFGQYRIGDGFFPTWYGERETNEGGEFKLGAAAPLFQNRAIDQRRADILKADIQRAAVDPIVQQEILEAVRTASYVYWAWVAAGQAYMVTQELLETAEERNAGIARQVETGDKAVTELQQNERLIATREAKLVEVRRKLQGAAIKLSLFNRDAEGRPVLPQFGQLPDAFPPVTAPDPEKLAQDIELALQTRPELRAIAFERESVGVDLDQAQNEFLPRLDAVVAASKDVGAPTSSKGDKTPFELEAGVLFDVPLQRRKASGKTQSAQGKLTQLVIKQRFQENKITNEVRDAVVAIQAAYERIEKTRRGVELARKLVNAEYRSFQLGNSDLLRIALLEGQELESQLLEVDALLDYFQALADYRAALGLLSPTN